jgi:hypothetical protein
MLSEKLIFILLLAVVAKAVPRKFILIIGILKILLIWLHFKTSNRLESKFLLTVIIASMGYHYILYMHFEPCDGLKTGASF